MKSKHGLIPSTLIQTMMDRSNEVQAVPHHVSEDCWFSCPKSSEGCCNPETPKDKCTCGADQYNAWLGELRAQKERLMSEVEELVTFLQEVDDKVKLGKYNLRSYYLLAKYKPDGKT